MSTQSATVAGLVRVHGARGKGPRGTRAKALKQLATTHNELARRARPHARSRPRAADVDPIRDAIEPVRTTPDRMSLANNARLQSILSTVKPFGEQGARTAYADARNAIAREFNWSQDVAAKTVRRHQDRLAA